jgi:hypothetical protein
MNPETPVMRTQEPLGRVVWREDMLKDKEELKNESKEFLEDCQWENIRIWFFERRLLSSR